MNFSKITGFKKNKHLEVASEEAVYGFAVISNVNPAWVTYFGSYAYVIGCFHTVSQMVYTINETNETPEDQCYINKIIYKLEDLKPVYVVTKMSLTPLQAQSVGSSSRHKLVLRDLSSIENDNVEAFNQEF